MVITAGVVSAAFSGTKVVAGTALGAYRKWNDQEYKVLERAVLDGICEVIAADDRKPIERRKTPGSLIRKWRKKPDQPLAKGIVKYMIVEPDSAWHYEGEIHAWTMRLTDELESIPLPPESNGVRYGPFSPVEQTTMTICSWFTDASHLARLLDNRILSTADAEIMAGSPTRAYQQAWELCITVNVFATLCGPLGANYRLSIESGPSPLLDDFVWAARVGRVVARNVASKYEDLPTLEASRQQFLSDLRERVAQRQFDSLVKSINVLTRAVLVAVAVVVLALGADIAGVDQVDGWVQQALNYVSDG